MTKKSLIQELSLEEIGQVDGARKMSSRLVDGAQSAAAFGTAAGIVGAMPAAAFCYAVAATTFIAAAVLAETGN